jgi:protein ImuA
MATARADATLRHLRNSLATLEKNTGFSEEAGILPLCLPALDAALGGGLMRGTLHELAPAVPAQFGATTGFALALAALATADGRPALVIHTDFGAMEAGALYGPGLNCLGLPMERLIIVRVPRPIDVLWASEEALKSRGVAIVIAELPEAGAAADLTATQRLTLATRSSGSLGLLLRHRPSPLATAATTRWQVAAAPSTPDRYGGLGRTTFDLSLNRNKRGRCGRFLVCWDHHAHVFLPALSVDVAAAAADGPANPQRLASTG